MIGHVKKKKYIFVVNRLFFHLDSFPSLSLSRARAHLTSISITIHTHVHAFKKARVRRRPSLFFIPLTHVIYAQTKYISFMRAQ